MKVKWSLILAFVMWLNVVALGWLLVFGKVPVTPGMAVFIAFFFTAVFTSVHVSVRSEKES